MHTNADGTLLTFNLLIEEITGLQACTAIEDSLSGFETIFIAEGLKLKSRKIQIYGKGGSSFASRKRIEAEVLKSFLVNPNREIVASVSYSDGENIFSIAQLILKVETRPTHAKSPYVMLIASIVCSGGRKLATEKLEQVWIHLATSLSAFRGSFGHALKPMMLSEIGEVVVSSGVLLSSAALEHVGGVKYFDTCGTVRSRAIGGQVEALFLDEHEGAGLDRWADLLAEPFQFMYENGTFPVRSLIR
jgi:hypothetical protein